MMEPLLLENAFADYQISELSVFFGQCEYAYCSHSYQITKETEEKI